MIDSFPLFVFGTGQRCGSTLMQRLLLSHPDAFCWGENGGHLESMLEAAENLLAKSASLGGQAARQDFEELGYQAFIANLIPPPAEVADAFKSFVEQLYRRKPVWGFKEVRHDLGFAQRLLAFFPSLKIIAIVRDPRDILSSIDEWETKGNWQRQATRDLIASWHRIAQSFLDRPAEVPALVFRYEDYTADPAGTADQISEFTGLNRSGFDLTVFDRRIHMHGRKGEGTRNLRSWAELPDDMRALLDDDAIRQTAKAFGYELARLP